MKCDVCIETGSFRYLILVFKIRNITLDETIFKQTIAMRRGTMNDREQATTKTGAVK